MLISTLALALASTAAHAQAPSPALVTTARGAIRVTIGEAAHEAPAPPFLLEPGQLLELAEGALVVVLFEGAATQVFGPARVDHAALKQQPTAVKEGVDVLDELLGRHVSTAPAGVTRSGDVQLVRPVPGSALTAPRALSWRCGGCGEQAVTISDLLTGDEVWRGRGDDEVDYGGPPLSAGAYALTLQGRDFAFTVIGDAQRRTAERAAQAARQAAAELAGADLGARTSVEASVWLHAGLASDALYVVDEALVAHPDDASLIALRRALEQRAGLAP